MSASVASNPREAVASLGGLDVVGFFTAEHGVGEAARSLVDTLRTAEVPLNTINYTDTESRTDHPYPTDDTYAHRVLFLALNADHIAAARARLDNEVFAGKYVIGQWFWELETPPPWFFDAFPIVNELWAPTRFIEQMLVKCCPPHVKVRYMPPAVVTPAVGEVSNRRHFGPDGRFMFYFSFDFMSIMKRKNPVGLIEAYTRAFVPGDGAQLVIKSINGDKRTTDAAAVMTAIGDRDDITLMTEYQSRRDASTLMSMADCYASLHRSEGLGLTIAEAMALGVPTIATGYSGNLDFMDEWDTWRVPCTMTRVGGGAGGYDPKAQWAEPDLDAAARMMREVWENPSAAREKADRARARLLESFSPERCGARMRARLEDIWAELERG
jgi:glycosyltransferase involved in cell wall biosynthesis